MIQPTNSTKTFDSIIQNTSQQVVTSPKSKSRTFVSGCADSFVKHTSDSAPVFGALALFWSFVDKARYGSFLKSLKHNALHFFVPVLAITSAVTALIENVPKKKPRENT